MLTPKVQDICKKYGYIHCDECPLQAVCELDHHMLPGATEKEQIDLWEQIVNMTAKEVKE